MTTIKVLETVVLLKGVGVMGMGWVGLGFFVPIKSGFCEWFHCIFNPLSGTVVKVLPVPLQI